MSFFGNQGQSRKRHEAQWQAENEAKAAEAQEASDLASRNEAARTAAGDRLKGGRASTILTSEQGDLNDPRSAKRTLLGV